MKINRLISDVGNVWVITVLLAVITLFHFSNWGSVPGIHEFLRRLYFIPIILAAFRYGLSGGLITSIVAGIAYAPHLFMVKGNAEIQIINQIMEIVLFITLGVITGVLSDIQMEQQAELENKLNQVQQLEREVRVADRLAAVGQLASGVAHEIRNPLGIIKAAAQIARPETTGHPDALESIEVIIKEVDRANLVVSQLLDFAKPHSTQFRKCNLAEILNDAILITGKYGSQHGVELFPEMKFKEMTIEADAEQLKQALVNLILNAVQAMPAGGKVYITAGLKTNHKGVAEEILIEITDNGTGIPMDQMPRIFDPFYTSKEKGTGLGLSIVHRIIQEHGGSIYIESQVGKGTSVYIGLPAYGGGGKIG